MSSPSCDELWNLLYVGITAEGKLNDVMRSFRELQSERERVAMMSNYLQQFKLMPSNFKYSDGLKDADKSVTLRSQGNRAFQKEEDKRALELYTECIAYAPLPCGKGDDELSLGFANRSAVLFSRGQYDACLADIEQALQYNYPCSLRHKLMERRGKCLQHQGKLSEAQNSYQEAGYYLSLYSQSDLKKAHLEDNISKLQEQLKSVKLSCEVPEPQQQQSTLPSKSYGQHEAFPSASKCVDLHYSPEKGRSLQANRDIRPGDVIIVEKPYASRLKPEYYRTHCYNCLKRHNVLIPCLTCSEVMYCSENCRSESWEESHQVECQLLSTFHKLFTGNLVTKVVAKASACGKKLLELCNLVKKLENDSQRSPRQLGFDENGLYKPDEYAAIYHLCGNSEKMQLASVWSCAFKAACFLNILEERSPFFKDVVGTDDFHHVKAVIGGLLVKHLQNLQSSKYGVGICIKSGESFDMCSIGSAVYATASLLNHSCDPNVAKFDHEGDIAVF